MLILLFFAGRAQARNIPVAALQTGDLIFHDLDCGPLCDAIEAVTPSYKGHHFSHIGIILKEKERVYVLEAIGAGVKQTALDSFRMRSPHPCFIGVLKKKYRYLAAPAVQFARAKTGVPYDDDFLYDNGKYYCSELVYDAFRIANGDRPFFRMFPMTYKEPGSDRFFPAWEQYFKEKEQAIPEGLPGCNPGGISRSPRLRMYRLTP